MNFEIRTIPTFDKQAKRLAKKYPSLKQDLAELFEKVSKNPFQGTALSKGFYKVRLSIASTNKRQSGGARAITFVRVDQEQVFFTTIYVKSEKDSISKRELEDILNELIIN